MDPNPIKHAGTLMKRLQCELEPDLVSAGFVFDGAGPPSPLPSSKSVDYVRPGIVLSLSYDNSDGRLTGEAMIDDREYRSISVVSLGGLRTTPELITRLDEFISAVREFVRKLPPV